MIDYWSATMKKNDMSWFTNFCFFGVLWRGKSCCTILVDWDSQKMCLCSILLLLLSTCVCPKSFCCSCCFVLIKKLFRIFFSLECLSNWIKSHKQAFLARWVHIVPFSRSLLTQQSGITAGYSYNRERTFFVWLQRWRALRCRFNDTKWNQSVFYSPPCNFTLQLLQLRFFQAFARVSISRVNVTVSELGGEISKSTSIAW